jgi:hypothetical protein
MAKSALFALKNTTVVFFVAGSTIQTDPATGNRTVEKVELAYDFYLTPGNSSRSSPSIARMDGADKYDRLLSGWAVSPKKLDSRIIRGVKCSINYSRVNSTGIVRDINFPFGQDGFGSLLTNVLGDTILLEQVWGN